MIARLPPIPAWSAALIATLVGFGGTIALVVQAMRHLGASTDQTASAVTALCLGIAVGGAALSFRLRIPVVLAWSTPGAALLAAAPAGLSWPVAVGAFLSAAAMMVAAGAIPAFARAAERIPTGIAAAMLAGVLLPFCLQLFRLAAVDPLLVGLLLAVFIVARRRLPLYAMLLALAAGMALTLLRGDISALPPGDTLGSLSAIVPAFDVRVILSLGLPLFLVTLVSQNLPGLAVLRSAGYEPPARPLVLGSGLAWLVTAPFGAHGVNLAAITAAICTNAEAHPDRDKRWTVGVIYAGFYLLLALIAPMAVRLFLALPTNVIAALTGLALIPALLGAVETMLGDETTREPAILTFLAAGSGLTLFGLGSAFWGLAVGFVALAILRR
ncbi:benzoate/H(+) symporter BenE family transporter [Sphingoaurantiacus capsulatus]|uniref:Benzoate/H(+) symporter BenE family transporter n=1 Tax=Sphingoaurantiacus capsulatus TaxID=1771310 RepID=A0ABV7X6I6_9SPHN